MAGLALFVALVGYYGWANIVHAVASARRQLDSALARAKAGQAIDELLVEIAEIQQAINRLPAVSLQDACVKLRRLSAHLGPGEPALAGALAAVERAAAAN